MFLKINNIFLLVMLILIIFPFVLSVNNNELLCCIDNEGRCYANRDGCSNFEAYVDDEDCKVERCNFGCCKADSCFLGFKQECGNLQGEFFSDIIDIDECKDKCEIKEENKIGEEQITASGSSTYKKLKCKDSYYTDYRAYRCPTCPDSYTKSCERRNDYWIYFEERAKCEKEYYSSCSLNPICEKGDKVEELGCEEEVDKNEYKKLKCKDAYWTDWQAYKCPDCPNGYKRTCRRGNDFWVYWEEQARCEKEYETECTISPTCGASMDVGFGVCGDGQEQPKEEPAEQPKTCKEAVITIDPNIGGENIQLIVEDEDIIKTINFLKVIKWPAKGEVGGTVHFAISENKKKVYFAFEGILSEISLEIEDYCGDIVSKVVTDEDISNVLLAIDDTEAPEYNLLVATLKDKPKLIMRDNIYLENYIFDYEYLRKIDVYIGFINPSSRFPPDIVYVDTNDPERVNGRNFWLISAPYNWFGRLAELEFPRTVTSIDFYGVDFRGNLLNIGDYKASNLIDGGISLNKSELIEMGIIPEDKEPPSYAILPYSRDGSSSYSIISFDESEIDFETIRIHEIKISPDGKEEVTRIFPTGKRFYYIFSDPKFNEKINNGYKIKLSVLVSDKFQNTINKEVSSEEIIDALLRYKGDDTVTVFKSNETLKTMMVIPG